MNDLYDLIIIGTGPAGLTAGIYSSVYKMKTLIIGEKIGGYAADAFKIINFPGYPEISGIELMNNYKKHIDTFKVPVEVGMVEKIKKQKDYFQIYSGKKTYIAKTVLIASGTERKKLQIPGENEYIGKGVGYCATCDAFFFKGKFVAVVGGSDSALTAALQLTKFAKKVYLIFRKDAPTGLPEWLNEVKNNNKITMIPLANVKKIIGNNKVEKIELDKEYNKSHELAVDGIFIEIGSIPVSGILNDLNVETNEKGFIKVDKTQMTNIKGIYAAGDISTNSNGFEQIITASAEGAVAVNSIFKYLRQK